MKWLVETLASRVAGPVRFDEPLAQYTTYRIGGPARALVVPRSTEDVVAVLQFCNEAAVRWLPLGLGSNVLIDDAGFDGVVIRLGKGSDWIEEVDEDPEIWRVGAGMPTPRLARSTARAGLSGIHRLVGVPGTVGGGVVMNSGAHGQEFSQTVAKVDVVGPGGTVETIPGSDVTWRYRDSGIAGVVVTAATFRFTPGDPAVLNREIQRNLAWRKKGTPFDKPCCGSVFRNPRGSDRSAGQLIDGAGMKGLRIGGAQVSPLHANYIVNTGGATATDVKAVIGTVREKVEKEYGIELELEVRIVDQRGSDPDG
ncbi:MAG: UDP-N-acetylmuramate dehydrogenase [Gemmatimonadota bacterium]|nr:MAG: UDP-N-acetylmuramate dehydrogenase [Gemmatimonadota bacterium]